MEFKNQFSTLLEATREDIKKYYPKISDEDYNKILDADKTGSKDKVGNLGRLVLDLYKKDAFKLDKETLFDIYSAFDVVQKKKDSLVGTEFEKYRNLNAITKAETLLDIKHYLDQKTASKVKLKAGEGENIKVFFEDEDWKVLIPLDYQASVKLGREFKANWCTASSAAMVHFNRYIAQDDLYVIVYKPTNEAWQYFDHGKNAGGVEFHNNKNIPVKLSDFKENFNLPSHLFFDDIEEESEKISNDENYYDERILERYKTSKSPYVILSVLYRKNSEDLIDKIFKIYKPNLEEKLLISDDGGSKTYVTLNVELYINSPKYSTIKYDKTTVEMLCGKYDFTKYKINDDLSIDIWPNKSHHNSNGFEGEVFKKAPLKINKAYGSFYCCNSEMLESLENGPVWVEHNYTCENNTILKSLKGAPKYVGGNFECEWSDNLTCLVGAPKQVGGNFVCTSENYNLDFFDGLPDKIGGNFEYTCNKRLSDSQKNWIRKYIIDECWVGGDIIIR